MTKKVSTPKQTSGAGFAFEDKVVAHYLLEMLLESEPFVNRRGTIARVDCQVRADGWLLDDLLLSLASDSLTNRIAFSIKSNKQFSANKAPKDFVLDAWSLLLQRHKPMFNVEQDRMGLILPTLSENLRTSLNSLIGKANDQRPEQLHHRINQEGYASAEERSLYDSFSCPENLSGNNAEDSLYAGSLIQHLMFVPMDFDLFESQCEKTAIANCGRLLNNLDHGDARKLWSAICRIAQRIRNNGGGIDSSDLRSELSEAFDFLPAFRYRADLGRLRKACTRDLVLVNDKIAGSIHVERGAYAEEFLHKTTQTSATALIGESGSGKSVLAKMVASRFMDSGDVLWFDAGSLGAGSVNRYSSERGLMHPLEELLEATQHNPWLLVIDSAERLTSEDSLREVSRILAALAGPDKDRGRTHVLFVCRIESWEQVEISLCSHVVEWRSVVVEHVKQLEFDDLMRVWERYPMLAKLAQVPSLAHVLCTPSILNLVVTALDRGASLPSKQWISEVSIFQWYWNYEVRNRTNGPLIERVLTKYAALLADRGDHWIAEKELSNKELTLAAQIPSIVISSAEGTSKCFVHDVYEEWARLRHLVNKVGEDIQVLEIKSTNPRWRSTIRKYGAYLLESADFPESWLRTLLACQQAYPLLLDSLTICSDPNSSFEQVWPYLVADSGKLLRAYLARFRQFASMPDEEWKRLAATLKFNVLEATASNRVPIPIYWEKVLPFLATKADEVVSLAPRETADVAALYLQASQPDAPLRMEAATLAVKCGWYAYRAKHWRASKECFTAAMSAIRECPAEVRTLALKASGRIPPDALDGVAFDDYTPTGAPIDLPDFLGYGHDSVIPEPWPDGPVAHPNQAFQEVCLAGNALLPVIRYAPLLAQEVILALSIKRKMPKKRGDREAPWELPWEMVEINPIEGLDSPLYSTGPFLPFLHLHPETGIQTIVRLVEFAAKQYCSLGERASNEIPGITLWIEGKEKRFIGDSQLLYWYHSDSAPDVVTTALMALEKWLYTEIDAGKQIVQWIDYILSTIETVSILGILAEVARYLDHLVEGPLFALASSPDMLESEILPQLRLGLPTPFFKGEWYFDKVRDWAIMPHRKRRLIDIASTRFLESDLFRQRIQVTRQQWIEEIQDQSGNDYLRWLIEVFDLANWRSVTRSDGTSALFFIPPDNIRDVLETSHAEQVDYFLLTRPIDCRLRLKNKKALEENEVASFLEKTKALADSISVQPDNEFKTRYLDTLLGSITVVYILNKNWLIGNQVWRTWCLDQIEWVLNDPQKWFDAPEDTDSIGSHWIVFLSELAPVLLLDSPDEPKWRELLVAMIFMPFHESRAALFERSFALRRELGEDFNRLVWILLEWAQINVPKRVFGESEYSPEQWVEQTKARFVNGDIPSSLSQWGEQSTSSGFLQLDPHFRNWSNKDDTNHLRRVPKIDLWLVSKTLGEIRMLERSAPDDERAFAFQFWEQAAIVVGDAIRLFNIDGTPSLEKTEVQYPSDPYRWLLRQLALAVALAETDQDRVNILDVSINTGFGAHHWVKVFLSHLFLVAKQTVDNLQFFAVWSCVVDYFVERYYRNESSKDSRTDLASTGLELLGVSGFSGSVYWQNQDADQLGKALKSIEEIALHALDSSSGTIFFLRWMREDSAIHLRQPLLEVVDRAIGDREASWWSREHLVPAVVHYLDKLWTEDPLLPVRVTNQTVAFLHLSSLAAMTNEPLALELQTRISAYRKGKI